MTRPGRLSDWTRRSSAVCPRRLNRRGRRSPGRRTTGIWTRSYRRGRRGPGNVLPEIWTRRSSAVSPRPRRARIRHWTRRSSAVILTHYERSTPTTVSWAPGSSAPCLAAQSAHHSIRLGASGSSGDGQPGVPSDLRGDGTRMAASCSLAHRQLSGDAGPRSFLLCSGCAGLSAGQTLAWVLETTAGK